MTNEFVTLGQLIDAGEASIQTGPFGTQFKASEYRSTGTPMINVKNIGQGAVKTEELERVGYETKERLASHVVQPGDIVFGRKGAVERHAFIREDQDGWMQGSDCIRLRLSSKRFLGRFVSYYLLTPRHRQWMLNQCSHGATMPSLNQDILRRIELAEVPLSNQQRIVGTLQPFDDLIENNLRRIEILEEMARLVCHELLSPQSGKRGAHERWMAKNLFDVAEVRYGYGFKSKQFHEGPDGSRVVRIRDIPRNASSTFTNEDPGDDYDVADGDILVGMDGEFHMCVWSAGDALLNQRVARFRPRIDVPRLWLYQALREPIAHFNATITGTTVAHLGDRHLRTVELLLPPADLMEHGRAQLHPIEQLIRNLRKQNVSLRDTRDLLLPRLISGEVDVSELDIDTSWLAA
jgi:type I restriction enzyme, S subunit